MVPAATADATGMTIGLDIGGTKTHAAAFDQEFGQAAEHRVQTATGGIEIVGTAVVDAVESLMALVAPNPVGRIGVGIPGLVDPLAGSVRQAVNLGIGNEPFSIVETLTSAFGIPCWVENDVNVAALGAYELLHRELDVRDLAYLSIGTGIAAGVILDGRIHRGQRGVAGEIGHLPLVPDGPPCECGLRGCLEAVASGSAIGRQWPSHDRAGSAEVLIREANGGNPRAVEILDRIADHLGHAVHLLALTFDVELVVIGGGVADLGDLFLDVIKSGLQRLESRSGLVRSLELPDRVLLKPDGAVGAIGAAALTGLHGSS